VNAGSRTNQNVAPAHAHVISEALAHSDIPVLLLPVQQTDAA
jgi:hypothetical protein